MWPIWETGTQQVIAANPRTDRIRAGTNGMQTATLGRKYFRCDFIDLVRVTLHAGHINDQYLQLFKTFFSKFKVQIQAQPVEDQKIVGLELEILKKYIEIKKEWIFERIRRLGKDDKALRGSSSKRNGLTRES